MPAQGRPQRCCRLVALAAMVELPQQPKSQNQLRPWRYSVVAGEALVSTTLRSHLERLALPGLVGLERQLRSRTSTLSGGQGPLAKVSRLQSMAQRMRAQRERQAGWGPDSLWAPTVLEAWNLLRPWRSFQVMVGYSVQTPCLPQ